MKFLLLLFAIFSSSLAFGSYPESESFTANAVPNQWIVVLKPDFSIDKFHTLFTETILKKFPMLNGVLVETSDPATLKRDGVLYVEANGMMHTLNQSQSNPPWNLDRIDSRNGLDHVYHYSETGQGVNVYVIDTGVMSSHTEFSGRIGNGYSAVSGDSSTEDCNGHGSHVSATILGTTYGVAKKAILHPVRVLDCQGQGTMDSILSGIEWTAANGQMPAVANMSLGGSKSQSINDAVTKAMAKGITFVVAAGNSSDDSCRYSPASTPGVITVAACDDQDTSASFTSFGSCVAIYAPGVSVLSAGITSTTSTATMSGTSMASPHVAGAAALLLERSPSANPTSITNQLINNATRSILSSVPSGTANLLVYTDPKAGTPTPTPTPPSDPGIPSECADTWACWTASGNLNPTTYYEQQPKDPITVNYSRPIKIYVKGTADIDIYLYYSKDGGQTWSVIQKADTVGTTKSMTYQANSRGLYTSIIMLKTSGTSGSYSSWIVK